jgi:hypothetical protein
MSKMQTSTKPARTARRWTKVDDANLRASVFNGLTSGQIAELLNRTTHSVHCRKNAIGMTDVRIAMPSGIVRKRSQKPIVTTSSVKTVKAKAPKQSVKTVKTKAPKQSDMVSAIAETVSKLTKQYGVKATVIVFEN